MGEVTAKSLPKESWHMQNACRKTILSEQFASPRDAQGIQVVIVRWPDNVILHLMHLEKAGANSIPSDTADFLDRGLQSFNRQMFQQVMKEADVKGLVCCRDVKHVAGPEIRPWKENRRVLYVFVA